jgi:hypothetical protein
MMAMCFTLLLPAVLAGSHPQGRTGYREPCGTRLAPYLFLRRFQARLSARLILSRCSFFID